MRHFGHINMAAALSGRTNLYKTKLPKGILFKLTNYRMRHAETMHILFLALPLNRKLIVILKKSKPSKTYIL